MKNPNVKEFAAQLASYYSEEKSVQSSQDDVYTRSPRAC
jgi:hypothetical protein